MKNTDYNAVQVLQLTDTHLYADPGQCLYGTNTTSTLMSVVHHILNAGATPELVLATGDLVHDCSESGYTLLGDILGRLEMPVYCIPGNHDDAAMMRRVMAGGRLKYLQDIDSGGWRLISLNSAMAGYVGGELSTGELARLEMSLDSGDGRHVLLALHHPAVQIGSRWLDRIGLMNAQDLWRIVERYPSVRGIVWGHAHQEYDAEWKGVRLLGTPSTCVQFKPLAEEFSLDTLSAGYRWIRLHPDGRIDTAVVRVDNSGFAANML